MNLENFGPHSSRRVLSRLTARVWGNGRWWGSGPLLFLIYVNDIAQTAPGVQVKLFADDTNLFLSGIDISELICRSNNCLESLNRWCIANRLHMNFEKKRMLWFFLSVTVMFLISALMDFLLQNYIVSWPSY